MIRGKNILLGITGGIAAYKGAELARLYVKGGAEVHVIMTAAAREFITPLTFQTLTGNPVHTDLFNLISEREIGHISLADRADLFVIAPATADIVGKIANGIADDMLSTTVMATKAPVLIAPAMNVNMYTNPIYRANEQKLRSLGYRFVDACRGMLACGWEGEGKLQDPAVIFEESVRALTKQDLAGERVLVTAGPTREEIDPVRFISNYSSGKMGFAIARRARLRGAEVVLVAGPTSLPVPWGVRGLPVESAEQMRCAVLENFESSTIVVKAAAVADYRPLKRSACKLKKQGDVPVLELERNPDILSELGGMKGGRLLVGFAAETHDLLENAQKKLHEKNLDLLVANDVTQPGAGFNVDTNIVKLLRRDGEVEEVSLMEKERIADLILDRIQTLREDLNKDRP